MFTILPHPLGYFCVRVIKTFFFQRDPGQSPLLLAVPCLCCHVTLLLSPSHRQGQKVATCLFITSPRSSETRSSCKCSCLLATSSLPKSLWTERLIRANVSVSQNKKWIVLGGGGGWQGGGGQSIGNKHNQNKHAHTDSSHKQAWRCTGWDGKWTRPSPKIAPQPPSLHPSAPHPIYSSPFHQFSPYPF